MDDSELIKQEDIGSPKGASSAVPPSVFGPLGVDVDVPPAISGGVVNNFPDIPFAGGLDAMASFVEQQLGNAEKHLSSLANSMPRTSAQDWLKCHGMPQGQSVHGNAQTGYRSDLRVGADVRPVMNCHQCKSNKKTDDLVFCGHISIDAKGYSTTCTKRYCRQCLWNWYMEQAPKNDDPLDPMWSIWRCPACRKLCCCHRCRTGPKVQRGLDMTDLQEQAGTLSPARCLARCLQDAGFPESEIEKQEPREGRKKPAKPPLAMP